MDVNGIITIERPQAYNLHVEKKWAVKSNFMP